MVCEGRKGQISLLLHPSERSSPFLQELGITEEQELVLVVCVGCGCECVYVVCVLCVCV